jgi:hypothetical protein
MSPDILSDGPVKDILRPVFLAVVFDSLDTLLFTNTVD